MSQFDVGEALAKPAAARPVLGRFTPVIAMTAFFWLVFLVNNLFMGGKLNRYGIIPRSISGLPGIICSPFLHGSFGHLAANTVPFVILGAIICARSEFAVVATGGIVLTGGLTWLLARNAVHIGASGLIFCFFGYIASLAFFRRSFATLLVSVVCIVGYGGMLRGIVPSSTGISWEGHLAGLISGVALAWMMTTMNKERSQSRGNPVAG